MNKGMLMMLKSILVGLGVDAQKIEQAIDNALSMTTNIVSRIEAIEHKLDLLLSRTTPADNETSVAYIAAGDSIKTVSGPMESLLEPIA